MSYDDLDGVMAIESSTKNPWSSRQMEAELNSDIGWQFIHKLPASSVIDGFIIGTLVAGEAEIRKLAVSKQQRRKKIASLLLKEALSYFRTKNANSCYLEVRKSNSAAKNLYLQNGFQIIGCRSNYYRNPHEDAIIMSKDLSLGGSL